MSIFRFKQFQVKQDICAQKVGTDGVLLGAWCDHLIHPSKILDIGSGCGVIALMLAQRFSEAFIDAIEIDINAATQAGYNFAHSQWSDRLTIHHMDVNKFKSTMNYDLIVSNPPFFKKDSVKQSSLQTERFTARFEDSMTLTSLLYRCSKLLSTDGTIAIIIPSDREVECTNIAQSFQLEITRTCYVKGNKTAPTKRVLLEFRFRESAQNNLLLPVKEELIIETARHQYTDEYIRLTKEFYLNF